MRYPDNQIPTDEVPELADQIQITRYLLIVGNACAFFVLTVANAPGLNIPFFNAVIKLVIPFFTTFAYIMNVAVTLGARKSW